MKINSIYISAFGGLKNLKLDLTDGFNVIYGDNENGKSTVMAFIKMMFYGSERGSSQLSKNIRKKYTPWDGSPMAGSIDFEHGGNEYRIEREFRSSNSTDKVSLCDLKLGTRQTVGGDIGNKFLGLSAAAFERSVFIGQFGFPESDTVAEGEINSKLSNIALTGDESVSFETVNSRLLKAKTALMSKSGKAGQYDKNLKACTELKSKIEHAYELQNDYNLKKSKIATLQAELESMLKSAQELKTKIAAEQDVRNAEKLKTLLELKAELDALNQSLALDNGDILDELFLRKLQFCISKFEAAKQKREEKLAQKAMLEKSISAGLNPDEDATEENAKKLENELKNLENKKAKIAELLPTLQNNAAVFQNDSAQNKGKIGAILPLSLGIIFIALAIISGVFKLFLPLIISGVIGLSLICFCPIMLSNQKKKLQKAAEAQNEINRKIDALELEEGKISEEIFSKKVKLESILASLNSSSAIIANQQALLKEVETALIALEAEERTESEALLQLYSRYRQAQSAAEVIEALDEISAKADSQKELKQKINFVLKDLGGISYEEARQKLKKIGINKTDLSVDFEELKQKYDGLIQDISEHKSAIASLTAQANANQSADKTVQKLSEELKQLLKITKAQKEFCDVADIAMQTLSESFAEIRKSYGSVLEKKAGEIFVGLTGEKYQAMSISKTFEINVSETEAFGSRDIAYLSSGTVDQAYLSLRLALSELICDGKETLPIMLDDALTQYDDNRMKTALEFLAQYSKQGQVIMFTCHNSISKAAKELGKANISLKALM